MGSKKKIEPLYWSVVELDSWRLILVADPHGLVYIDRDEAPYHEVEKWTARYYPGSPLLRDDERMRRYVQEMADYWQGKRTVFEMPLRFHGTEFQKSVWQALRDIGYGETCSYSELAVRIGRPAAVRAVGAAVGANPLMIVVPCHRVIGKSGALTGFSGGLDLKVRLLEIEGKAVKDGYVQYA